MENKVVGNRWTTDVGVDFQCGPRHVSDNVVLVHEFWAARVYSMELIAGSIRECPAIIDEIADKLLTHRKLVRTSIIEITNDHSLGCAAIAEAIVIVGIAGHIMNIVVVYADIIAVRIWGFFAINQKSSVHVRRWMRRVSSNVETLYREIVDSGDGDEIGDSCVSHLTNFTMPILGSPE